MDAAARKPILAFLAIFAEKSAKRILAKTLPTGVTDSGNFSSLHDSEVASDSVSADREFTIPIIEEELKVDIHRNVTGIVRVEKVTHEHEEVITKDLFREEVLVDRVSLNLYIDAIPEVRYEGDTMIVPVVEEILITTKQLVLREEVRVRRHRMHAVHLESIPLKTEEVVVTRRAAAAD